ncbi:MAG TPA: hypothetical protein VKC63_00495 [Solirubrobacterales bacterium]|nr:hypothetical protein [Solirubrobacterales bacterium]
MYDKVGKIALRFTITFLRRRYRREIRIGAGLGIVAIGIAIYLANRDVPEG